MNKGIYFIAISIMAVAIYFSSQTFKETENIKARIEKISDDNRLYSDRIKFLSSLPDNPARKLVDSYAGIYEYLRQWSSFYDFRQTVLIEGLGIDGAIDSAIKPSGWEGVQQLTLNISFYEAGSTGRYLAVFQTLQWLQEHYPLSMGSIVQSGKSVEAKFQLYGIR
jgi:hypothetical protein